MLDYTEEDKKRFLDKIEIDENTGCWNWAAGIGCNGYGNFWLNGKTVKAHRLSYEIFNRKIKNNEFVLHECDNPICVNPEHLFLGTQKDNIQDAVSKGRMCHGNKHHSKNKDNNLMKGDDHWSRKNPEKVKKGEKHINAKLTKNDILEIRSSGKLGSELAKIYGVDKSTVSLIKRRKTWKHI